MSVTDGCEQSMVEKIRGNDKFSDWSKGVTDGDELAHVTCTLCEIIFK